MPPNTFINKKRNELLLLVSKDKSLIKGVSKDVYNVTKDFYFKYSIFF